MIGVSQAKETQGRQVGIRGKTCVPIMHNYLSVHMLRGDFVNTAADYIVLRCSSEILWPRGP